MWPYCALAIVCTPGASQYVAPAWAPVWSKRAELSPAGTTMAPVGAWAGPCSAAVPHTCTGGADGGAVMAAVVGGAAVVVVGATVLVVVVVAGSVVVVAASVVGDGSVVTVVVAGSADVVVAAPGAADPEQPLDIQSATTAAHRTGRPRR
jgi:hypothetical protein